MYSPVSVCLSVSCMSLSLSLSVSVLGPSWQLAVPVRNTVILHFQCYDTLVQVIGKGIQFVEVLPQQFPKVHF